MKLPAVGDTKHVAAHRGRSWRVTTELGRSIPVAKSHRDTSEVHNRLPSVDWADPHESRGAVSASSITERSISGVLAANEGDARFHSVAVRPSYSPATGRTPVLAGIQADYEDSSATSRPSEYWPKGLLPRSATIDPSAASSKT
jgi:hypothetical protein